MSPGGKTWQLETPSVAIGFMIQLPTAGRLSPQCQPRATVSIPLPLAKAGMSLVEERVPVGAPYSH